MPQALLPTTTMLTHWAVFALYLSVAMAILRAGGNAFGPLVLKKWPGAYAFFAAAWQFLGTAVNDVFAVLGKQPPSAPTEK